MWLWLLRLNTAVMLRNYEDGVAAMRGVLWHDEPLQARGWRGGVRRAVMTHCMSSSCSRVGSCRRSTRRGCLLLDIKLRKRLV